MKLTTRIKTAGSLALLGLGCCSPFCMAQSDIRADHQHRLEKLQSVHSIFVAGNNQAAQRIREELEKGKTCFSPALRGADADAVLDVNADGVHTRSNAVLADIREWIVSGNLTNATGELLWSDSVHFGDAPFMSGAKTAAKHLLGDLRRQVCKK